MPARDQQQQSGTRLLWPFRRRLMITSAFVDPDELAKFSPADWWDEHGNYAQLHRIHPVRMGWIADTIRKHAAHPTLVATPESPVVNPESIPSTPPYSDHAGSIDLHRLSALDVGCGGGMVCESLHRLGLGAVTGVDANETAIEVAIKHAQSAFGDAVHSHHGNGDNPSYGHSSAPGRNEGENRGTLAYHHASIDSLRASIMRGETLPFDVVTCLEVVEHVKDLNGFVAAVADCVAEGGLVIFSTLARTRLARYLAVHLAEGIGWVPKGTHDWKKFVNPSELAQQCRVGGLNPFVTCGMIYDPRTAEWCMHPHRLRINYFLAATKPVIQPDRAGQ
ncbi:MAG: methyltransferase domain-containing protein [Alphaproteobacteria bacterium]|nr:methyltransferase domain-containing protein [Alphaproteobacteria bacterium]